MNDIDLYELITKESFLNYCFERKSEDILYWENWLTTHPEQAGRINVVKAMVLFARESARKKILDKNFNELEKRINNPAKAKHNHMTISLWPRISIAALILIISSVGVFYSGFFDKKEDHKTNLMEHITPGKTGATLTLGNGKKIYISDEGSGQIAEQAGVTISKTSGGEILYEIKEGAGSRFEYNRIETKYGEQAEVILPDHSKVFLNAGSSISYPSNFSSTAGRVVRLQGEAYFEVSPDKKSPFTVATERQEVRVLGTHFNVSSYSSEKTETTLLEGAVEIKVIGAAGRLPGFRKTLILEPGQQSILGRTNLQVVKVDISKGIDWTNGDFRFKNEKLKNIMPKLARWYNVEIVYADDAPLDLSLSGEISRSKKINSVLNLIESTGKVHFKLKDRTITVSK
ncbi:transmembrane sensor [Pedobacter africanus]|uniref:Ferric-dicitrate binding protein FerR (Iron transport regulator) n=1 Tax=Pedobacter africanus TaxID=151894 RepID=A0ACC6L2E0_9SPHI|nr:FecR domain-containing protein [Pedobacter africanus]MDR6785519.1 ferric-dicitrate binding protein FerR (iron transport regulator) [Pedobacter africanus]